MAMETTRREETLAWQTNERCKWVTMTRAHHDLDQRWWPRWQSCLINRTRWMHLYTLGWIWYNNSQVDCLPWAGELALTFQTGWYGCHMKMECCRFVCCPRDLDQWWSPYKSILPFFQAEVSISALRLDNMLHIGVSCMHMELEWCRFMHCPAVYSFCGIDVTAFGRGKHIKHPKNPAMSKLRLEGREQNKGRCRS